MIKGIHGRSQRAEKMQAPEEQGKQSAGLRREVREGLQEESTAGEERRKGDQRNS